jgi:hypothetical protein
MRGMFGVTAITRLDTRRNDLNLELRIGAHIQLERSWHIVMSNH